MKHHLLNSLLPFTPLLLISLCAPLPPARAQSVPSRINLLVIEGEGAAGAVRQRVARDPVVKVEDDDHRPVAGAAVVFALPVSGTSGEFLNGSKTLTMVTGADGLAAARGIKLNDVPGKLQVYVTASYRGLRARTLVSQIVEAAPGSRTQSAEVRAKSGGKWKWVALSVLAAGGAGAGLYYQRHNTTAAPVSISAGSVVFGSPR